ncbi:MAG TPA: hypothetical protein VMS37_19240 [Verrucomicrobiae bacterium]|nr:hypothetical protein [Verrucomicrobiae bacterium]
MIAGILIIAFSAVLFAYWLRYSCLLLLRNATERANLQAADDERFSVGQVMEGLRTGRELDPLEASLQRDYCILSYLLEHTADLEMASVENRLLLIDYKLMRVWSHMTRTLAPRQSRKALEEMASVLSVLIRALSQPSGIRAEA